LGNGKILEKIGGGLSVHFLTKKMLEHRHGERLAKTTRTENQRNHLAFNKFLNKQGLVDQQAAVPDHSTKIRMCYFNFMTDQWHKALFFFANFHYRLNKCFSDQHEGAGAGSSSTTKLKEGAYSVKNAESNRQGSAASYFFKLGTSWFEASEKCARACSCSS